MIYLQMIFPQFKSLVQVSPGSSLKPQILLYKANKKLLLFLYHKEQMIKIATRLRGRQRTHQGRQTGET